MMRKNNPNLINEAALDKMAFIMFILCADPEGGGGGKAPGPPPPEKSKKKIEFLSNTSPDPLENHKAAKPAFNVGPLSARKRNAI